MKSNKVEERTGCKGLPSLIVVNLPVAILYPFFGVVLVRGQNPRHTARASSWRGQPKL